MCNYRWNWKDCCSRRVSREDVKVVRNMPLNARTRGVVCQDQEFFLSFDANVQFHDKTKTPFAECFAGNQDYPGA